MKILKIAIIALLTSAALVACKKENVDSVQQPFTIEGKWVGTTNGSGYFGMNIKSGGSLDRLNSSGSIVASGNWELKGDSLLGNYQFLSSGTEVIFKALVNRTQNTFSGNWSNSGGEVGTMTASKK
jgi:hypothetical protein